MSINYLNGLIISALVIFTPFLFTFIFWLLKINLNKIKMVYLYAFATGLIIIIGGFGFLKESYENLNEYFTNNKNSLSQVIITSIISAGVLTGFLIGIIIKYLFIFNNKRMCKNHKKNICGDCVFDNKPVIKTNKNNLIKIILISFHKLIDGLSLGFLMYESKNELMSISNLGIIIGFIIHIIPMTIVTYYLMLEKNNNKKSFICLLKINANNLIIIPFIFIGVAVSNNINSIYWLIPLLLSISGGTLLFTSIMELAPEFLHNNHLCTKEWIITVLWLMIGILLAVSLTIFHNHSHNTNIRY